VTFLRWHCLLVRCLMSRGTTPTKTKPKSKSGEAVLAYRKEHSHRPKMTAYQTDRAIASILTVSKLHENEPIYVVTREQCKRW